MSVFGLGEKTSQLPTKMGEGYQKTKTGV